MAVKRKVEVFTAGTTACAETLRLVDQIACCSCTVTLHDMNDPEVAAWAKRMGIHVAPKVVIDGMQVPCRDGSTPDETALRQAGLGRPVPSPEG